MLLDETVCTVEPVTDCALVLSSAYTTGWDSAAEAVVFPAAPV